jgi:L-fuconolactonase
MNVIDAHQHYWQTARFDYGWMCQGMPALDRDFLPEELKPQLAAAAVAETVLVQVLHTEDETRWMLDLAATHGSIAGVVGWVDLTAPPEAIHASLDVFLADPRFVGIRHLVHDEPDDDWLAREDVVRGLGVLEERDVPYDLLLRPQHLRHVPRLSERLPRLRMVIDHLAKPYIREHRLEPWTTDMVAAAENQNVWCKVSGMVTEADHERWTADDLAPYIEAVLQAFGAERLMFGSDWPVCTLAASYERVIGALREVLARIDEPAQTAIFESTARTFYRLDGQDDRRSPSASRS